MSACPPTAAEKRTSPEVREVPKADSCTCKQRAEPRCENSISHKKSVEKKTVSIAGFLIYPSLWAIIVYGAVVHIRSVRPQANRALFFWQGEAFSYVPGTPAEPPRLSWQGALQRGRQYHGRSRSNRQSAQGGSLPLPQ